MTKNLTLNLYLQNEVILEYAAFRKSKFDEHFKNVDINSYNDPAVRRKLQILKDIGTAALSDGDLTDLNAAKNRMSTIYNSARICPVDNPYCNLAVEGLTLDPEIELLLASSTNFDEMKWTWEQWHEKSGKNMRDDYKKYVALMNKAAMANGNYLCPQSTLKSSSFYIFNNSQQIIRMQEKCGDQSMKTQH